MSAQQAKHGIIQNFLQERSVRSCWSKKISTVSPKVRGEEFSVQKIFIIS